jgi:hypothetical protein
MTFATVTNLATIIFCTAVLIQSVRMMRSVAALKAVDLPQMVKALDSSTEQARAVLSELKATLRTDGAANLRRVAEAETIRDELGVMIGIANATADRLLETAGAAKPKGKQSEAQGQELAA